MLVLSLFLSYSNTAVSALVPEGTVLAKRQVLVQGNGAEPATLDPQIAGLDTPEDAILQDLFEGLVIIDGNGNVQPGQAFGWQHSEDGKTWTFNLRPEARWSDNTQVTAADFVYAWHRLADPATAAPSANLLERIGLINAPEVIRGKLSPEKLGIQAIDKQTLQIKLEKPLPYFLRLLAMTPLMPAKQKVLEKYGKSWTQPEHFISNGPYVLKQWVVNERVEAKKNNFYWNHKNTVIRQVTYLPIASPGAEYQRFQAGEINYTNFVPLSHYKAITEKKPEILHSRGLPGTYIYSFNTRIKPFDNINVRKALSLALDRHLIAEAVVGQGQIPAYTVVPDSLSNYQPLIPATARETQLERNKRAKKLLAEAGYSPERPLNVTVLYNTSESHQTVALAIASMWKQLGVNVTLQNMEWNAYRDSKQRGQFQISRSYAIAGYNDPSALLDRFHSGHPENESGYSNPELDKLLDKARSMMNPVERQRLYHQAETILSRDMPVIPIYQYVQTHLTSPYLKGLPKAAVINLAARDVYFISDSSDS